MCCGQRKATPQQIQTIKARRAAALPGADGLMLIEYIGGNIGTAPYYGPVTGTRYEAGKKKNLIYIDQQDAVTGNARKPGLLEMKDNGKAVFRKYSPPTAELNISAEEAERVNPGTLAAAAVEIEPEPVPEPEPEPVKKTRRSRK